MATISKAARCLWVVTLTWLGVCFAAHGTQVAPPAGQEVTLGWKASADPTVVGYSFYYGTVPGVYTNKINVGTNTMFTVSGLVPGSTNYFTTTSYNVSGIESSYVPEVSYLVPGILTVTQNRTNDSMLIQFPVAPGQSYQLQASSNLMSWSNVWLTPTETTNGWIEYEDPATNKLSAKFYRLILY
jgi:hypothetical protein